MLLHPHPSRRRGKSVARRTLFPRLLFYVLFASLLPFFSTTLPAFAGEYQTPTPLPVQTVITEATLTPVPPPPPPVLVTDTPVPPPAATTDTPVPLPTEPPPAPPPPPPVATATSTVAAQPTHTATPVPVPPTATTVPPSATASAEPPSHTATTIPTFTRTATRTATPSATATSTTTPTGTPNWLPPGPECKPQPSRPIVKLAVPFIQQVVDLGGVDGNWACGPTSVAMVLAYYGKLQPWNEYLAQQQPTAIALKDRTESGAPAPKIPPTRTPVYDAEYVPYITRAYSNNGHDYTRTAADPRGNKLAGLYGTICPTGLADWGMMRSVLQWHGLTANQIPATWEGVIAALKRGHPVILGNGLTPAGHVLVATGYAAHNQLIVNDPYGNRFSGGYGSTNGEGLFYPWSCSRVRVALEVIGVYPPPSPTATASPTATVTSTITVTPPVTATSAAVTPQSPLANGSTAPTGRDNNSREGSSRGSSSEGNVKALSVAPPRPQAEAESLVGIAPIVTGDQALRWAAVFFLVVVAMGSLLGRNGLVARRRRFAQARAEATSPEAKTTDGA